MDTLFLDSGALRRVLRARAGERWVAALVLLSALLAACANQQVHRGEMRTLQQRREVSSQGSKELALLRQ